MADLPGHLRMGQQATGEAGGQAEGLFDLRVGEDVMALVANGVGGGSLINAGVMLEPDPQDLRRQDFKTQIQALKDEGWYQRARVALGAERAGPGGPQLNTIALHPAHAAQPLAKAQAMHGLAARHQQARVLPITVAMTHGPNAAGVNLPACTLCGDCMTGCNIGAKDSLDVNLLRQAVQAGAQLFTGASVSRVLPWQAPAPGDSGSESAAQSQTEAQDTRWVVEVEHTRADLQAREAGPLKLHARHVILAAGTLGSTELLLRSRSAELAFSQRLGERFSCNGDNIGAVHRLPQATQGYADETTALDARRVGPTITTGVAFGPLPRQGSRPFWLQEFSVPGALRRLFEEIVTTGHAVHQLPQADLQRHGAAADPATDPAAVDPVAMGRTLLVGVIGHDDADGVLALPRSGQAALGTLRIHWPQARDSRTLDTASAVLQRRVDHLRSLQAEAADAQGKAPPDGPHWVPNPMWRLLPDALSTLADQPRGPVLTVHPLGGCPMGQSAAQGVVDHLGRVFDGRDPQGQAVHPGLVVLDGAIVPESLGANPSLTIAALALRAAEALRPLWGLRPPAAAAPGSSLPSPPSSPPSSPSSSPSSSGYPRPLAPPRPPLPGQTPPSPPRPTRVAVIERLTGPLWLDLGDAPGGARPWVVEWTLAYRPERLDTLTAPLNRCLTVDEDSPHSRLRVYDASTWEARGLAGQTDEWRHRHAVLETQLSGTLRFLHREDSFALQRMVRGLWAWAHHRGGRDLYQRLAEGHFGLRKLRRALGLELPEVRPKPGLRELLAGALRSASRAGEVRRFDYHLTVGQVLRCSLRGPEGQALAPLRTGDVLQGHKRLTYAAPGNPWRQLTELQVTRMPGLATSGPKAQAGATLVLDPRFLASRQTPLLHVVDQPDQVQALADLAALGMTLLRLMASVHLWTFRKPDTPLTREPVRLPQPINGLPLPQITEWAVAAASAGRPEARVRLTRYPPRSDDTRPRQPALVMIHGYSVSGNTFTHESLRPSAAEWFHRQGRDVWVVDLRTSSGLPTATTPWTLEDVALVDIPAALLQVRQVTGGPVDVLAHCVGCVMLSMALLSRPQELMERARSLDRAPPLDEAQQAVLAAFNGPGGAVVHPTVHRLVLSQKGPVLRYTDANVLRGWFMQYARRWLLRDGFQFRPSAQPGAGEQLLDRLLASLPYPDADWRVENPRRPWKRTPWTATRHRMDVLYGRDFEATGLRPATLEAIDDLFGPIHLDTVSQTIHFTQSDQATDHTGAGDYVTPQRLRERWAGIETLALHGRDNGLADVFTQRLLGLHLGAAGLPFAARTFDGMGHQDLLIGKDSVRVFEEVERFLRQGPAAFGAQAASASAGGRKDGRKGGRTGGLAVRAPWLGPRLDVLDVRERVQVRVAAMPPLDAGLARLVLVPARRTAQGWRLAHGRFGLSRQPAHSRQWQFVKAARLLAPGPCAQDAAAARAAPDGWLALMVYGPGEQQDLPMDVPWPGLNGPGPVGPSPASALVGTARKRLKAARVCIRRWLRTAATEDIEACLVPRAALQRLVHHVPADQPAQRRPQVSGHGPLAGAECDTASKEWPRLHLAVASCQYPHGPLDREPAQASLQSMARVADEGGLDLALFLGDQVYADATAGLVDATRRDERYEGPHETAQRAHGLRSVLARVPTVMLLDDHEMVDNWEPRPPGAAASLPLWRTREDALRDGRWGYWKYERLRPQLRVKPERDLADKGFVFAGLPIYLADTRTGRSARGSSVPPGLAHILGAHVDGTHPGQFQTLEDWLRQYRDVPKVVATPSLLLPRRAEVVVDPANAPRSDAWDGYPASLHRLLDFLLREQIQHTVFVSGDEHHALVCEVTLAPAAQMSAGLHAIRLTSVHSSALYAPFPFANGHPADLSDDPFVTPGGTRVTLKTRFAPPGDGWSRVSLTPGQGDGGLEVGFYKPGLGGWCP
jgi:choline dehydrogenase-like flavoprotein